MVTYPPLPAASAPTQVYGTYRWGTVCGDDEQLLPGAGYPQAGTGVDWTAWHVFSVEWNASGMVFSVDGVAYETTAATGRVWPSAPQFVIINAAVAPFFCSSDRAIELTSYTRSSGVE